MTRHHPHNDMLRAARLRLVSPSGSGRSLSRQELAQAVTSYLFKVHGLRVALDDTYIGKLERGDHRWPNERYREAFRAVLGVQKDADLGFFVIRDAHQALAYQEDDDAAWTAANAIAHLTNAGTLDRRRMLATSGTLLMAVVGGWSGGAPPLAPGMDKGRIGASAATRIEAIVDNLRLLDAEVGGGSLIGIARSQLSMLVKILKDSRYEAEVGRRLFRAASDLSGLLGWFLLDAGQHISAQRHFFASLRAAHVAADPTIAAATMSYMAVQSYSAGNPYDAPRLAQAAVDLIKGNPIPLVRSMLAIREARGYAKDRAGRSACEKALLKAERMFAAGPTDDDPDWLYWMSPGELHGQAASCYLDLEDYKRAVDRFQEAIDSYDMYCVRDRAMCLTRRATALVKLGRVEEAYSDAQHAIELGERIDSTRLHDHWRTLDSAFRDHGPANLAADFRERIRDLIRPTVPSPSGG